MNDGARLSLPCACIIVVLLAGCASQGVAGPGAQSSAPGPQSSPKRITAAIKFDPPTLVVKLNPATVAGVDQLEDLVNAGLGVFGEHDVLRPVLAEAIPSAENGLWKLFPDGTMETTWRIRPNARWHDGTPFTSDDLVFTAQVVQDPEIVVLRDVAYSFIAAVEAPDPRTITVWWKQPFIEADTLFTRQLAQPMPKHILERVYLDDKASFTDNPYFNAAFVGTGPFRVQEFVGGSHLLLRASDDYVLGRPKIDEIEVKFIPDPTVLVANVLAGSVELSLGRGISLEQAAQVRDRWRDGHVENALKSWLVIYPQFINPNPAIITDVRFRRALMCTRSTASSSSIRCSSASCPLPTASSARANPSTATSKIATSSATSMIRDVPCSLLRVWATRERRTAPSATLPTDACRWSSARSRTTSIRRRCLPWRPTGSERESARRRW